MINIDSKVSRPRGRPRAFDRDTALVVAAETFWDMGYEGASIADLTAAMQITPQSLYAAFRSKADLYKEALDWYQTAVGGFIVRALQEPDVFVGFEQILLGSAREFRYPGRPTGCMISAAVLACATENRPMAELVSTLRKSALSAFEQRIRQGVSDGMLAPETDATALSRFIAVVIQGMAVQARDDASQAELEAVALLAMQELRRHEAQH